MSFACGCEGNYKTASCMAFTSGGGGTDAVRRWFVKAPWITDRMRLHFHAAPFLIGTSLSAERCQLCGDRQIGSDSIVGASFESDCKSHSSKLGNRAIYCVLFVCVCVSERMHLVHFVHFIASRNAAARTHSAGVSRLPFPLYQTRSRAQKTRSRCDRSHASNYLDRF